MAQDSAEKIRIYTHVVELLVSLEVQLSLLTLLNYPQHLARDSNVRPAVGKVRAYMCIHNLHEP